MPSALQGLINEEGVLPGGEEYLNVVRYLHGNMATVHPAEAALIAEQQSDQIAVGEHPEGFGQVFSWNRQDDRVAIAAYVNTQDCSGLCIKNMLQGDIVQVTSMTGIAAFDTDDAADDFFPSFFAAIGSVVEGFVPESWENAVSKGEELANRMYRLLDPEDTKRRDAFGEDPDSGHHAREEGGVLITLPSGHGPYYSGDDDHESRWIQGNGLRVERNYPKHFIAGTAYFPARQQEPVLVECPQDGELFISPWDHIFEDNAGYYLVNLLLAQGKVYPASAIRMEKAQSSAMLYLRTDTGVLSATYAMAVYDAHVSVFERKELGDGCIALKACNGMFVQAINGILRADVRAIVPEARFWVTSGPGVIGLQACNQKYVTITGDVVAANSDSIQWIRTLAA